MQTPLCTLSDAMVKYSETRVLKSEAGKWNKA